MEADRGAPAFAEGEISIDVPRALVWLVLVDFVGWPRWNPGVSNVTMAGALEPGTEFRWKSGRTTIRSTLVDVDAPGAISWTGKTTGIKAKHAWQLDDHDGDTVVRTQESWSGLVAKLLHHSIQPTLQQAIDDSLVALKTESERRV